MYYRSLAILKAEGSGLRANPCQSVQSVVKEERQKTTTFAKTSVVKESKKTKVKK
jgi:hypothetical protein